jgi:hypothetical protein
VPPGPREPARRRSTHIKRRAREKDVLKNKCKVKEEKEEEEEEDAEEEAILNKQPRKI